MSEPFSLSLSISAKNAALQDDLKKISSLLSVGDFDKIPEVINASPFSVSATTIKDAAKSILLPWSELAESANYSEENVIVVKSLNELILQECLLTLIVSGKDKIKIVCEGYGSVADDFCALFLLYITSYKVPDFTAYAESSYGWSASWEYVDGSLILGEHEMMEM